MSRQYDAALFPAGNSDDSTPSVVLPCPACGHRLTEVGTEEVDNHYLCNPEDIHTGDGRSFLKAPYARGCGSEWDYDLTPWVPWNGEV